MRRLKNTALSRLLTILLIAGVSLCCCTVRILAAGGAAGAEACASSVNSGLSCCAKTTDQDPDQEPSGDSCCDCCLKATQIESSKQITLKLDAADVTAVAGWGGVNALAGAERVSTSAYGCAVRYAGDAPTLLRLRCALII